MLPTEVVPQSPIGGKTTLAASVLVFLFWSAVQVVDVYRSAVVGAVFEMLWLPMLAGLFAIPILSLVVIVKGRAQSRSLYVSSLVVIGLTAIVIAVSTVMHR